MLLPWSACTWQTRQHHHGDQIAILRHNANLRRVQRIQVIRRESDLRPSLALWGWMQSEEGVLRR